MCMIPMAHISSEKTANRSMGFGSHIAFHVARIQHCILHSFRYSSRIAHHVSRSTPHSSLTSYYSLPSNKNPCGLHPSLYTLRNR